MYAIVAANSDWGIGFGGVQSIVIPEDRRYFNRLTEGGVVIAGRKTFEQIRKPLPNRKNIVLTQTMDFIADGVIIAHSVEEALAEIAGDAPDKVFVIGGGSIYKIFLPLCTNAYVTRIEATPPSDTYFPDLETLPGWTREHKGDVSRYDGIQYSFNVYKNNSVF